MIGTRVETTPSDGEAIAAVRVIIYEAAQKIGAVLSHSALSVDKPRAEHAFQTLQEVKNSLCDSIVLGRQLALQAAQTSADTTAAALCGLSPEVLRYWSTVYHAPREFTTVSSPDMTRPWYGDKVILDPRTNPELVRMFASSAPSTQVAAGNTAPAPTPAPRLDSFATSSSPGTASSTATEPAE